jgi:hypothetical protein
MPAAGFSRKRMLFWLILGVAVVAGGFGAWWFLSKSQRKPTDMIAAMSLNNRGVGLMERFDYPEAVKTFEELVEFAPDWLPGKINLVIALLNNPDNKYPPQDDPNLLRAISIFQGILKEDAGNLHAHFCLGVIFKYQGKISEAHRQFEQVTRLDPTDAHAWYNLGHTEENRNLQKEYYEKAIRLNPYLRRALNGLQSLVRPENPKRADDLLRIFEGLNKVYDVEKLRYGEMGHYGEVIGQRHLQNDKIQFGPVPLFIRNDQFQAKLKTGTRWAKGEDFGQGMVAELRRAIRKRFGATIVVLDYNRDGKPDLFLLSAVVEGGRVRDLLLRNDGNDVFTDVTHEAGLAEPRLGLGCTVGDFDNDGFPDLFITGIGKQWLFRNKGKADHGFADITAKAGIDKVDGVCLGSCFVDLDQDGDLDLVVAKYAASAKDALNLLNKGAGPKTQGGFEIFLNVGEAKPANPNEDPPPLNPAFRQLQQQGGLQVSEAAVAVAATDLERDGDLDLLLLADNAPGAALLNDRLLRFRRTFLPKTLVSSRLWNGALVLDANHQGRSDLFLISPDRAPLFIVSKPVPPGQKDTDQWFEKGVCNSPPLAQAQAIDLDYDGWTDIIGLSNKRIPVLLHNQGGKLVFVPEGFGSDQAWPKDLVGMVAANLNNDKHAHLLTWSENTGLAMFRNRGNDNQALKLDFSGHRKVESSGTITRCNADGFGLRVTAQTEGFWTGAENTTLSAGLGQSRQPLILGLGKHSQAEVIRLRWPDNCWQAELNKPACHVIRIDEINRKRDCCPILFAWDGKRFTFISDILGAGAMGEALPDRTCRQPRPEESIKIETHQLVPKDGFYILKVAEAMNEVTYLDQLKLEVVDHPAQVRAYPDERFVISGPPPSQELLAFRCDRRIFPGKAKDHKGKDVTLKLRKWDRDTVDDFARRAWTGYAEEHWLELDFGEQLAGFGAKDRINLFLAGWTDYPYPESIWAATQAGIPLQAPVLERKMPDGTWKTLVAEAGFPAGLPRMTTLDLTGRLTGPNCVLRLRTNMHVFWDQIFLAPILNRLAGDIPWRTTSLKVSSAILEERGCMQEFSPDGKQPTIYDYYRIDKVPVNLQSGSLTRLGDVTELLEEPDDRFVIFGPGDEITVQFDGRKLPALPAGWKRSFLLRAAGYSKSSGPFIETGDTVAPLPFRKMSRFPYGPLETYPRTPRHDEYRRRYNTRQVGSR